MPIENQQTTPAPEPGTPEHDAAMIAKFNTSGTGAVKAAEGYNYKAPEQTPEEKAKAEAEATAAAAAAKPQKPADIPDKFWNAEKGEVDVSAMAKSYAELEKSRTAPKEEPAATVEPPVDHFKQVAETSAAAAVAKAAHEASPDDAELKTKFEAAQKAADDAIKAAKTPAPADAEKTLENAGLNMAEFQAEYDANGKLSDEAYAKLEKAGITRETADSYIAGQQAIANERTASGKALVGGAEKYDAMVAWAGANLTVDEKVAFNTAVNGTPEEMAQAVSALNTKYTAAVGSDPTLLGGSVNNGAQAEGFTSRRQMTAAINDPRYQKDPAYRAAVEKKIQNARFA